MTRSEAYETRDPSAANRDLAWELPEGLWQDEQRREIPPPPAAIWRTHGPVARSMTFFADLPVPPRAAGAPRPATVTPVFPTPVDSFFAPRQSGTWVCGTGSPVPTRPPSRPGHIPIPPAPRISSPPLRAAELLASPPKRARLRLHLEEERDAGLVRERQLFGIPLRRSLRACGAVLLGAALIGMASDWSPGDRGGTETATDQATSTDLNAVLQPSPEWESHLASAATTPVDAASSGSDQPARLAKRTLSAGLARGLFRQRARADRAERAASGQDDLDESAAELDVEPTSAEGTVVLEANGASVESTDEAASMAPPATARVGRTVTRAQLISSPRPRYPDLARQRGIDGTVVVRFKIDAHGRVREAAIDHSDPPGVFDRAALHAIENSRYRPRIEDGEAVATPKVKKRFSFHVRGAAE